MAISEKRLLANRANSKKAAGKCTGPRNTSLTRFNAVRHGMTSTLSVILPGESEVDFKKLAAEIKDKLCPQNEIEEEVAGRMAHCIWRLRRGRMAEQAIVEKYAGIEGIRWDDLLKSGYLEKICKYERMLTSYLRKFLNEIL